MKCYLLIPLTLITMLFIGCEKSQEESGNSSITINKIEQNITNKETNLGCRNSKNSEEECTDNLEMDSAKFILSTLNKDLNSQKEADIDAIKKNLNISLKKISEEENKKIKLKDSLEALVNNLSENKKKNLEEFVNQINDSEFKRVDEGRLDVSSSKKISTIRDELKNLIEVEDTKVNSKVVKNRLERLISNVSESKKNLDQTEKSLKNLVKEAEERDTPSVKKFTSTIIEDVSSKKISIIDENEQYLVVKVKQGENLSMLAKRYYNDEGKYKLIYEANKDKISSKYEIYPDTELLIPKI